MMNVADIREYFKTQLENENFTIDRTSTKTLELIGASFLANEEAIFGTLNNEYIKAEIDWYESMSNNIHHIKYGTKPPAAWIATASSAGEINSNYGLLIFSEKYHSQYKNALDELIKNPNSRRATMVYTRPSIWNEYNEEGKNDFICTNAVSYYIRDNKIHCVVQMRSNDAWAGYRNDRAWQFYVLNKMCQDYNKDVIPGDIIWQVQNLHIYSRNFYLVDAYAKGHYSLTKKEYTELYPNSPYCH
jgi:thymidylate synthase